MRPTRNVSTATEEVRQLEAPRHARVIPSLQGAELRGRIHVAVSLKATERSRKRYQADFLADTGATDSMAPAAELRRIGVRPVGRMSYELADSSVIEFEFGLCVIEFLGQITAGRVIFGPDDGEPILGVTALESVGVMIDPVTRSLRRLPAIPLKPSRRSLI